MRHRAGEKAGWIGGWLGSILWLFILSLVWLFGGKIGLGTIGLLLFVSAILLFFLTFPWRHPRTKYWKLMLPLYAIFFASALFAILSEGGFKALGLNWWSLLTLLPFFLPLFSMSQRCWQDGER